MLDELYILKYMVNRGGEIESPEIMVGVDRKTLMDFIKDFNKKNAEYEQSIDEDFYSIDVIDLETLSKYKTEKLF